MAKNLMIIESPNKIKTIAHYLQNEDVELLATYGHLRDLSKFGMGFNKDLDPNWVVVQNQFKSKKNATSVSSASVLEQILTAAKTADKIYLSTDPDREGEAIAWHVWSLLPPADREKCERVVFNEITTKAIHEALEHPRKIDLNQVNSYLARRLLDREFGYKLSGFVKRNFGGISAGRVQSVALKFLKLREDEIAQFIPESWYTLDVVLKPNWELNLKEISDKISGYQLKKDVASNKICFADLTSAETVLGALSPDYTFVKEHPTKEEKIKPKNALKTSTMQQEGINRFKTTSRRIEAAAQKLYEGVTVAGEIVSLITYPRTDRTDFSDTFKQEAEDYIKTTYGPEYWVGTQVSKKTQNKATTKTNLVQGAHEGIRPTDLSWTPAKVKPYLEKTEYNLYCLIWVMALGSLMSPSIYQYKYYDFSNNGCLFNSFVRNLKFDGFERLFYEYKFKKETLEEESDLDETTSKNQTVKDLVLNKTYPAKTAEIVKHDKKPPARYNEASLIKVLEQEGIGRPSTYATIANTVLKRDYANKKDAALVPTEMGINIIINLQKNFPDIMSFDYTRQMEMGLDEIANDQVNWKDFLKNIFKNFQSKLVEAKKTEPQVVLEYVDRECPLCKSPLIYRKTFKTKVAKKFIGCSKYPQCRFIESLEKPDFTGEDCPQCQHPLVRRKSRFGTIFIGCSFFPKCRFLKDDPDNPNPKKTKKTKAN